MAVRALTGTGTTPSLLSLSKHLSSLWSTFLPATAITQGLQAGVPHGQQQQYSSSSKGHICSSTCSCHAEPQSVSSTNVLQCSALSGSNCNAVVSRSRSSRGLLESGYSSSLLPAAVRGFASVSTPSAHAGCGHSHHHDEDCGDEVTVQIRQAGDLPQLQQLLQQNSSSSDLTASRTAAAFRRAAVLANDTPDAAGPVLDILAPVWPRVLAEAVGKDLSDVLLSWTKLQVKDESLWQPTLAAVPAQIKVASGQDLANIAYALAAMSEINGGIPGVSRPDVQELLRAVTEEVVSLVQGKPAGEAGGDGCGGDRSVSVGNLATVRWAHEVFDETGHTG